MKERKNKGGESVAEQPLPRHARVYVPPHSIPEQPDAATMENRTIRLDPRVDPRFALTRVDQHTIRSKRRVWWGLFFGSALGTVLGCLIWLGARSTTPAEARVTESAASASLGAKSVDWASLRSVDEQLRGQGAADDAVASNANASMLPANGGAADAAAVDSESSGESRDVRVEETVDDDAASDEAVGERSAGADAVSAVKALETSASAPLASVGARRPSVARVRPSRNAQTGRAGQANDAIATPEPKAAPAPNDSTSDNPASSNPAGSNPVGRENRNTPAEGSEKPNGSQNQVWVKPQEPKVWLK